MVRLASGFQQAGHEVEVLTLRPEGGFRSELSPGVTLTALPAKRIMTAVPAVARHLKKSRPEAFLVTEPACNIAVLLAKIFARTKSRVLIREGLFPSIAARDCPYRSTRVAYKLAPLLYRYADVIVAIAEDMADDLARFARLERDRVYTVRVNPVVTERLIRSAMRKPEHPWFERDYPIILGVGRLDDQKDFATLLHAFEEVRTRTRCRLLIYGDGPLRRDLERLKEKSAYACDIDIAGFNVDPFAAMANCTVFVLPSRYEGQPNVLIEALACGAPVVATDCPSGPREILENGRYGELVPIGDPTSMANAIASKLKQPLDRESSRRRGMAYTVEHSAALYQEVLFGKAGTL